jgi:D-serine deaminase-like pyridoxal phosphate-dependent protein
MGGSGVPVCILASRQGAEAEEGEAGLTVRPGTPLDRLPTPCLVVDLDRLERNLSTWQRAASAHGVRLRPHVKTHKTLEIGRMQLAAGAAGITVAKVAEAEVFVAGGFDDVVIAYPVVGEEKWARVAALARRARITLNVESATAARGLSAAAAACDAEVVVHLDVDSGLGRSGVPSDQPGELLGLARLVEGLPGLRLEGLTTYRSLGFAGAAGVAPDRAGREEGELVVRLAELLRQAGIELREVAAGSTPTGRAVAAVAGVTEVRAGTYAFNDLMQLSLGAAAEDDLALSVLATVVSARPGRVTVDAGSKTLSGDVVLSDDAGRVIARAAGRDVTLTWMNEEHGVGRAGESVEVGERLQLHPVHVCTCVNLSDELIGIRGGVVETVWPVAARGHRT